MSETTSTGYETHCPECGRELEWYRISHGTARETLYTRHKDSHIVCAECLGVKERTVGAVLHKLNKKRQEGG